MLREICHRIDWVLVGGRWTRISVMGTNLSSESFHENKYDVENCVVVLMIPGNPGNEGFYRDFGQKVLRSLLSREERMGNRERHYLFYTSSERFQLDEQVQHKLDFVLEHLPKAAKIYILGHSIGAYMMLRILPYIKDEFNVKKAIGLFPTVEKLADSPNGLRLRRVLAMLDSNQWLAKLLSFWLDYIPNSMKRWLVLWNVDGDVAPDNVIVAATELLNMNVFRNIVHLSNDEFNKVNDLDDTLVVNKELLYFYYGKQDGWCPEELGYLMEQRLPDGHVLVDEQGCEHAFVIRDGATIAEKLLQFIK
ncbi:hypothetical protein DICVIV_12500 [Dictyocaulus viviparus]|uniref:Lipid droplet-associated hydrolase n=1 Tax=Dictyocaulus viviparus TaxID=29172 RepID=A0A0D8XAD0_DICVI|nr:hypothetical protein DICVIV_12500 [Dictyocaulus viviparus]